MTHRIASTAIIDPHAVIGSDVTIGDYCVIGPDVSIGRGTYLDCHVTLKGRVTIGEENHFHPGSVMGGEPQDVSYQDEPTEVIIGDRNIFREGVTVNRGTMKEEGITSIGNDCYFMASTHIGHDCRLGNHIVTVNGVMFGGHVHVHDHATISGCAGVHHFGTVGSYSFVSGLSRVLHDVPPYMLAEGMPARPRCVNVVALKRNNFAPEVIQALSEAHRLIYRSKVGLDNAREILRGNEKLFPQVNHLLSFIQDQQEGRHGRARERRRAA